MKRRDFVGSATAAAVAWPFATRAQQSGIRRIGVLMGYPESDVEAQAFLAAFRGGLQDHGWKEGHNTRIDARWAAAADATAMQRYAKELVALQPEVIFSSTTPTTAALLKQTQTIPIVFAIVADPIGSGFVANFREPGGNVTGFAVTEGSLGSKWPELLKQIAPQVTRVGFLFNPTTTPFAEIYLGPFRAAAATLGLEATTAPVRDGSELEAMIAAQAREPNGSLIVMPESFTTAYRVEITALAARYRLPAIYAYRFFVAHGGLVAYGVDLADNCRRAAGYADRILKGEKPGDLPVQAPDRYQLIINLKSAKALGLVIPPSILARADEVIE